MAQAVYTLQQGGTIAYPTEGVWGLGCDPDREAAVEKILALKHRPRAKGLILIAAAWEQLAPYLLPLAPAVQTRVFATWPGPVTWLLPAAPDVPNYLRGDHPTLAVRITAHPLCRELCQRWGKPLVSTSANPAGHAPALTREEVQKYFKAEIDYLLDGDLTDPGSPSTIRDALSGDIVRL